MFAGNTPPPLSAPKPSFEPLTSGNPNLMLDPIIPEHVQLARHVYHLLQPGQEKLVAAMCISQAALDHYLSGATGSAYTLGYIFPGNRPDTWKNWTLFRLPKSLENDPHGRRSYVDPDRRHLYAYDNYSGLYTPNKDHPINFKHQ